jgi:two-component system, chemotaxis family, protein-glutamate methylesterase/glutaminase
MKRTLPEDFSFAADLVAVGASAGGIDALLTLLDQVPAPLHVPIVVVLHLPDDRESRLADLFSTRLKVAVDEAQPHAPIEPRVYFAPPGYHLLVEQDLTFSLNCEPPVQFSRPSIDVLFESAAEACGERLLGILLTGANEDGARGLARIQELGGLTAVQDPAEAGHATMPAAAIRLRPPAYILPLAGLRSLLHTAVHR